MSDLIDRQAAIDSIEKHLRFGDELYPLTDTDKVLNHAFSIAASCVYNLPSAQPERKTGRWIPQKDKWGDYVTTVDGYVCSECNNFDCMEENYCPNCGARMEGES